MTTLQVITTTGIPGSGKSTWAKSVLTQEPDKWKRINFDELRLTIDDGKWSKINEKIIIDIRNLVIKEALLNNMNVIIDNTHVLDRGKHFKDISKLVASLNLDVEVKEKHFYVDLEEAIKRNANREIKVPEEVIRKFWKESGGEKFKNYQERKEVFTHREIAKINNDPSKEKAIIVDLDGTLAHATTRNIYDASTCDEDLPDEAVMKVIRAMRHFYDYSIIFCSGREEKFREPTVRFLEKHLPDIKYKLFMRKTSDKRHDDDVKEEIFRTEIEGKYFIEFMLDDRDRVVRRYRSMGLIVWQVAEGNF